MRARIHQSVARLRSELAKMTLRNKCIGLESFDDNHRKADSEHCLVRLEPDQL